MEVYVKESDRWLRQAEYDLKVAEWNQQGGFHSPACFWAQQAAAKALRSFLFFYSEDAGESRSVTDLLDRALTYEEEFKTAVGKSTNLDLYYKTARFPDALPGGIPAEILTGRDSTEAIRTASDILAMVEKKRKGFLPETM
ncbi:MAG TPA: HEPN domain-containing protein [Gammaproteobacteria bacterium]|nr:HEPN domain-containing protein [Gammaproteobacteria bacterium]